MSIRDRLAEATERAAAVERELSEPATVRDAKRMASLGREHQRLQATVQLAERLRKADEELVQARELLTTDDAELAAEARSEVTRLTSTIATLEEQAKPLIIPHDPLDDRPCIVEIRAGTGGDEAALFAADLHRMYTRYI
ncbi:MAG TPA: PCRF domain-containing protein, partial [Gemmatimonadaceae bacterium]|nr:PCRF domain-containing protein [Gemmatimonadaceae bacterium]